jgi:hypothetical protein
MLEVDLLLHPSFRFKSSSAENSGVGIVNSIRFKEKSMKLAAPVCRQAGTARGFPAMIYYLILCPFLPAGRQGPRPEGGACGARSGHVARCTLE